MNSQIQRKSIDGSIRFRKLIENSYEGISLLNKSFEIVYQSPAAKRITGWDTENLVNVSMQDIVHHEDYEPVEKLLQELLITPGFSKSCIFQIKIYNEHFIWLECMFTNMLEDQDVQAIICNFKDITESKKIGLLLFEANQKLYAHQSAPNKSTTIPDFTGSGLSETNRKPDQNNLKLLEYVIMHTNDAIMITEAEPLDSPGPCITYVNEAFTRITGYTSEEVIGKSPRILQGPKTDNKELKRLSEALHKWESCETTVVNYKKNGEEFWTNFTVTPVADENDQYTHWISINRDITERRKQEQEYNQIFHHAPDIICTVDSEGYLKKANPAMSAVLEYGEEELLAMPIAKFMHTDDQLKIMTELKAKHKSTFYFESRCVTRSGQIKWLAWTSTPATDEGLIILVAKDITEKRKLEDLLSKVTLLAGIGAWVIDLVKNTVYWSDITREIHEVTPDYEPAIDMAVNFFKEAEDREFITQQIMQSIEKGTSFDIELQIVTARQNVKWVRVIGEPEFENNACVRVRGSFQDIDIRKTAELAAISSLSEKNIILESIGDAFFAVDKNWIVSYWNNMAEKVLHKSKLQMTGHHLWDVFSPIENSESYSKYHQAVSTNKSVHFEDYYAPLEKWYEISAYPSDNGLSVYFKDITERKKTSSALEESEKNYSALFHLSPLPMWVFDLETLAFLDINAAAIINYGYSREEFLSMKINDIRPVEDIPKLNKVLVRKNVSQKILVSQGIFRHKKKKGEFIQVDIQSNLMRYQGKPAKIVIANDMTERYNYITEIEEQNTKLKEIAWMQSHVVRAPLTRIMGIVPMIKEWNKYPDDLETLLEYLTIAANELDDVIKSISDKTNNVNDKR